MVDPYLQFMQRKRKQRQRQPIKNHPLLTMVKFLRFITDHGSYTALRKFNTARNLNDNENKVLNVIGATPKSNPKEMEMGRSDVHVWHKHLLPRDEIMLLLRMRLQ